MRVSRANFLKVCAAGFVGVRVDARVLSSGAMDPSTRTLLTRLTARLTRGRLRLEEADAELFRQHLRSPFAVRTAEGTRTRMTLAKVVERPVVKNVEQFSLTFHAPPATAIPQGTHAFHHPELGRFDLFIVPIGAPTGRPTVYQACFSRLRSRDDIVLGRAIAPAQRRT